MDQEYGSPYEITEVKTAIRLDATIERMRREIDSSCTGLSRRARSLSLTNRNIALRLERWEAQLDQIRVSTRSTSSIEQLEGLMKRCEKISWELSEHCKK
jgi:hypothetical protein